jgi:phytoene dehydrogenase-like protein
MSGKWIVAALAAPLLWVPAAFADEGGRGGGEHQWRHRGESRQERCADHYARKVGRLAYLEAKLSLTDAQRAGWTKWRQSEIDAAEQRKTSCLQNQPKEGERPTAVEREARAEKWLSTRLAQLQASRPALQTLYDSLTPEQKVTFDRAAHGHRHHGWQHNRWQGGERGGMQRE